MSEPSNRTEDVVYCLSSDDLSVRRSACDRCRNHKLKCDREDNTDLRAVCRRCSRAGAVCKTSSTAPIGRPPGPFRQQYEQRGLKRRRVSNTASTHPRSHLNGTQVPTPSSSMADHVSDASFISADRHQELLTPSSNAAEQPNTYEIILPKRVESPIDMPQFASGVVNPVGGSMFESGSSSIAFTTPVNQQESLVQRIADLHSDLASNLHIAKGSQRIDECAWITTMPELTGGYNFLVGRTLGNATKLLEILHLFIGHPSECDEQGDVRCDTPTLLSILTCYVYLLRTYRYTFTSIAKSVPIMSTSTVKLPLLFPGLHLAGFSLEPHMDLQIQVLVQVAETLLGRIDQALGILSGPDQHSQIGLLHRTGFPLHLVHAMIQNEHVEKHADGILVGDNEPLKDILAGLKKI